jgi:eukaryotic-like serine/threonine-protein kinase
MTGKTISHYRLIHVVGRGGMGVVYKAEDLRLKRNVALKVLAPELTGDPQAKERLIHEAQAASILQHQNICTIHEIGETGDGRAFICMDYYDGRTLKDILSETRTGGRSGMPLEQTVNIAIQITRGLAEAHGKGIIHRDIKPANILITNDGSVKILDFGLAKRFGINLQTQTGKAMGTIAYLSPEQAAGKKVDHRTDIWSFGVVLYEMVAGKRPFDREYDAAVIYAIIDKPPVPPSQAGGSVSATLEKVILKCLEKDPNRRYSAACDLLTELERIAGTPGLGNTGSPAGRRRPLLRIPKPWRRAVALASLSILVISGLVFVAPRFFRKPRPIQSLAVLPLENLSGDKAREYFVSGIHEELLTDLSKIRALRVISKTSVMQYEGTKKTAPEIAKELNVDALVEGSVMQVAGQVRINVHLIDGPADKDLWANTYDRDARNVLTMLSEVAQAVAGEIKIAVTRREKERIADVHLVNPEAHEEYLKGRYLSFLYNPAGFPEALIHFRRSTEIDPNFAPGYAGQAIVYFLMGYSGLKPDLDVIPQAKRMVSKALELDKSLGEAHTISSWIKLRYDWDWPGAAKEAKRALDINPNDAQALHAYGDYLLFVMGRINEGLQQVRLAREVDPFFPISVIPSIYHLQLVHRYDEIIAECRKLLAADPDYPDARGNLRDALWLKGNYEEAFVEFQKTYTWNDALQEAMRRGYQMSGPKGGLRELALTFAKQSVPHTGSALGVATLYAFIQEKDSTLVWLERAYEEHASGLIDIHGSPTYDFLGSDPRYRSLLQRIGFPEIKKDGWHG